LGKLGYRSLSALTEDSIKENVLSSDDQEKFIQPKKYWKKMMFISMEGNFGKKNKRDQNIKT
jgi:hypothetical protein